MDICILKLALILEDLTLEHCLLQSLCNVKFTKWSLYKYLEIVTINLGLNQEVNLG